MNAMAAPGRKEVHDPRRFRNKEGIVKIIRVEFHDDGRQVTECPGM